MIVRGLKNIHNTLILPIAAISIIVCIIYSLGSSRPWLMIEDGPVEYASAFLFLSSAVVGAMTLYKVGLDLVKRSLFTASVAMLALVLFLSEISFGARILDLQMPRMIGGGEFDGGHDIATVVLRGIKNGGMRSFVFSSMTAAIGISALYLLVTRWTLIEQCCKSRVFLSFVVVGALLGAGVTLDLMHSPQASLLEEAVEFTASIAFLYSTFLMRLEYLK